MEAPPERHEETSVKVDTTRRSREPQPEQLIGSLCWRLDMTKNETRPAKTFFNRASSATVLNASANARLTAKQRIAHARRLRQEKKACLALAATKYIARKAREFTRRELNMTQYSDADAEPLIPHIIHQQWSSYQIPAAAVPYVKSVVDLHPDWQYWFWTDDDRECYMRSRHPELLDLFDNNYTEPSYRTSLVQYLLLYDYGGVYLDLDVQALKPLDIWTHIASSVLSHEPYEQTFFAHLRRRPNVISAVMATRPEHPFFKLLQENLLKYHQTCPSLNLNANRVFHVDNIYQLYLRSRPNVKQSDDVMVIHPK